ncbi:MAG TPA: hypothetical protein VGR06_11070 [Actinophytocola sp.]|uniref:hypothetical protein n=1 Tax=Actinophytocola sp. TaxID=1872138 RepID=UPI002E0C5EAF|nr:hypothetical protein [Actinophytocola sp.]
MTEAVPAAPVPATPINATSIMAAAPGTGWAKVRVAGLRALRTLVQGVAGAVPSAGVGAAVLTSGYWTTLAYSCLAAGVGALVSFGQNMLSFLPDEAAN